MKTVNNPEQTKIAFINDNSPIIDLICNDLVASGYEVLLRSENIKDGLSQLSALKSLPNVCIIDLDFYDRNVLAQLRELKSKYPNIKLIAFSDKESEQAVIPLLEIGFDSYMLIGSDANDFKTAIEGGISDKRYFSMGVSKIAHEYYGNV